MRLIKWLGILMFLSGLTWLAVDKYKKENTLTNTNFLIIEKKLDTTNSFVLRLKNNSYTIPKSALNLTTPMLTYMEDDDGNLTGLSLQYKYNGIPVLGHLYSGTSYCDPVQCKYDEYFSGYTFALNENTNKYPYECAENILHDENSGLNYTHVKTYRNGGFLDRDVFFEGDPCNPDWWTECKTWEIAKAYHCETRIHINDYLTFKYRYSREHISEYKKIDKYLRGLFESYSSPDNRNRFDGLSLEQIERIISGKSKESDKYRLPDLNHHSIISLSIFNDAYKLRFVNERLRKKGNVYGDHRGELLAHHESNACWNGICKGELHNSYQTMVSIYTPFSKKEKCLVDAEVYSEAIRYQKFCKSFPKDSPGKGAEYCGAFYFEGDPCNPDYYAVCASIAGKNEYCRGNFTYDSIGDLTYYFPEDELEKQAEIKKSWMSLLDDIYSGTGSASQ